MTAAPKTLLEEELSEQIIHSIGVYVQLCARIEKLVVKSICLVENLEEASLSRRNEELSLLSTSELISSLRSVTKCLPSDHRWYSFFAELRPYLHRFVENRHKVVHGVVVSEPQFEVLFFDKKTKRTVSEEFDDEQVKVMISHADGIARALVRFCEEISVQ